MDAGEGAEARGKLRLRAVLCRFSSLCARLPLLPLGDSRRENRGSRVFAGGLQQPARPLVDLPPPAGRHASLLFHIPHAFVDEASRRVVPCCCVRARTVHTVMALVRPVRSARVINLIVTLRHAQWVATRQRLDASFAGRSLGAREFEGAASASWTTARGQRGGHPD